MSGSAIEMTVDYNLRPSEMKQLESMKLQAEEYIAVEVPVMQIDVAFNAGMLVLQTIAVIPAKFFATPPSLLAVHDKNYLRQYLQKDVGLTGGHVRLVVRRETIAGMGRPMLPTLERLEGEE